MRETRTAGRSGQEAIATGIAGGDGTSHGTERAQSIVRFYIAIAAGAYILIAVAAGLLGREAASLLLIYMSAFFVASTLLFVAIPRGPEVSHARRVVAMAMDYVSITLVLSVGGQFMLPIAAVLIWVTVGYGMRYGPRYLLAGTVAAVLSIAMTTTFSAFWRGNPYMVATFALTAMLVPVYANILLTRTRLAHEAALAANRAKSQLLAQASHDLRQPVHAIGLFTNCLRDAPLGPDEQLMVNRIEQSLQSVSRLFHSFLDVSTLDSGRVVVRREVVALNDLLREVVMQNSEGARWAGVELKAVPTGLRVVTDRALLTTTVQNLVSNALKYAPGGPVLLGCRRRRGRVAIEVHDRGPGIEAGHLRHVFDEFYRVERAGSDVEGVGLGLSIVRRMAGLMGVDVSIRSKVGRGTTVAIEGLQMAALDSGDEAPRRQHPTPLEGLRVLLIEDDQNVRAATAALLEKWGCAVTAVAAAPEGGCACDLIIADFELGAGGNGSDAIAAIRADCGELIPAILITGHDAALVRGRLEDDTPVLAKPVHPAELRAAVTAQWLCRPNALAAGAADALRTVGSEALLRGQGGRTGARGDAQRLQHARDMDADGEG